MTEVPTSKDRRAMDELESLQAKRIERVRRNAERELRSLIHTEYMRRLGRAMRSVKGMPFASRSARMREARRRIGINHDEVYGGELSAEAVLTINGSADAARYLSGTDEAAAGGTIFRGLRQLQIGESEITRVMAQASSSVKKSARLLRAEEAAERENTSTGRNSAGRQREDSLKQILAKRFRRQTLRVSKNVR